MSSPALGSVPGMAAETTFMRKIAQLARYKRSVFPYVRNLEAAGFRGIDVTDVADIYRIVRAEKAEGYPSRVESIEVEYIIKGKDLDPDKVAKAVALSEDKYCTVGGSLRDTVKMSNKIMMVRLILILLKMNLIWGLFQGNFQKKIMKAMVSRKVF